MGAVSSYFSPPPLRILMLGLDYSGKTTILQKLAHPNTDISLLPTIGFNLETLKFNQVDITVWDVASGVKARPLWRFFIERAQGLIYVVDTTDTVRIDEREDGVEDNAKARVEKALEEVELRHLPLLIYASKRDAQNSITVEEVIERLGLNTIKDRDWFVQGVSALQQPEALLEGIEWLKAAHKNRTKAGHVYSGKQQEYQSPPAVVADAEA